MKHRMSSQPLPEQICVTVTKQTFSRHPILPLLAIDPDYSVKVRPVNVQSPVMATR